MKTYPSIPNSNGQNFQGLGVVDVFDKLDGNNFRAEWSRKQGWHKFGTRTQMIDGSDPQFGPAVPFFCDTMGEWIPTCSKKIPNKLVVFAEWYSDESFGGQHPEGADMKMALIDCCWEQKGWLDPRDFRKAFEGKVPTATYLGQYNWTRGFVDRVREGEIDCTFEGVVGKTIQGGQLKMGKAKTQAWLDRVYANYPAHVAERMVKS